MLIGAHGDALPSTAFSTGTPFQALRLCYDQRNSTSEGRADLCHTFLVTFFIGTRTSNGVLDASACVPPRHRASTYHWTRLHAVRHRSGRQAKNSARIAEQETANQLL